MLYRVLRKLDAGKRGYLEPGSTTRLNWLQPDQVTYLVELEAVSEVSPPPLAILPGWHLRGRKLSGVGITDAAQLLEADPQVLAPQLQIRPETILAWQDECRRLLLVNVTSGGEN
jgi:hypothetical protein